MKRPARITLDPAVMGGKPGLRGLRVTVGTLLGLLAAEHSREEVLKSYPYLEAEDIDDALAAAARKHERSPCRRHEPSHSDQQESSPAAISPTACRDERMYRFG